LTTSVLITMLLASAGIAGLGLLLLGIQGRSRKSDKSGPLLANPAVGWFLVFVGGFLFLAAIISRVVSPPPSEPLLETVIGTSNEPSASPQGTSFPTLPTTPTALPTTPPTPVPPPVLEPGWSLRERPEDGFAIALPTSWVEMDLGASTLEEALLPVATCCPEMDLSLWEGQTVRELRESGLRLFAVDPDSDPEAVYYGVVSVVYTSLGEGWTLDMALQVVLGEDGGDESKLTHQRVTLPVGKAEKIQYADSGDPPVRTIKYLLVQYDAFWFITVGCEAEFAEFYEPIFATIPHTFRWIETPE
jgi:hypothetical protein